MHILLINERFGYLYKVFFFEVLIYDDVNTETIMEGKLHHARI